MKLLAILVIFGAIVLSPIVAYYSMHFAWGLEIKSWPAFFTAWGASFTSIMATAVASAALKD